jgi:homoserine O-succinyltransferase
MAFEVEARPDGLPAVAAVTAGLDIGLVNNMPDSALEGTEAQFTALLRAACGERTVRLRVASLADLPRGAEARALIEARYWPLETLLASKPDALIITGTEPKASLLSDEPYWRQLTDVMDHAATRTISSIFSCLAAHAVVLHLDAIPRRRLETKRFGVYSERIQVEHPLTANLGEVVRTPHSRWNDLSADALLDAGYTILSASADGGVGTFCRQGASLLLLFQGHPEYEERTLLKEYQRDVGRYISGEYRQYPVTPQGYFAAEAVALLGDFERGCQSAPPKSLAAFPFKEVARTLKNDWTPQAVQIYRNWLDFIETRKRNAAPAD